MFVKNFGSQDQVDRFKLSELTWILDIRLLGLQDASE